jgi:hypothetical protein
MIRTEITKMFGIGYPIICSLSSEVIQIPRACLPLLQNGMRP